MNKNFKRNITVIIISIILFFSQSNMSITFAKDNNDLYKEFFYELKLIDKEYDTLYVDEEQIANFLNKIGRLELNDNKTIQLLFDGDGRLEENELKKSFLHSLGYDIENEYSRSEIRKIFKKVNFKNDTAGVKRTTLYERLYNLLKLDLKGKNISLIRNLLDEEAIDTCTLYNLGSYKFNELLDGYKERLYMKDSVITIEDPIIMKEIRNAASEKHIPLKAGNKFHKSDLYFLKELYIEINSRDNSDFSDLGKLTELKDLTIDSFKYDLDISYIKNLKKLRSLEILAYKPCNLEIVKDMTHLESLQIYNQTHIEEAFDISFLREFKKLRVLKIRGLNIKGTRTIGELKQLRALDIGGVGNECIYDISRLKNLIYLSVGGNQVKDISRLSKLENLLYIDIGYINRGHNYPGLYNSIATLKKLRGISGIEIDGPIERKLENLNELELLDICEYNFDESHSYLSKKDNSYGLGYSPNMKIFFQDKNVEKYIRTIIGKGNEEEAIYYSDIRDISYLDLSDKNIESINDLIYFTGLKCLDIRNNKVRDLSPLKNIMYLSILRAEENPIEMENNDFLYDCLSKKLLNSDLDFQEIIYSDNKKKISNEIYYVESAEELYDVIEKALNNYYTEIRFKVTNININNETLFKLISDIIIKTKYGRTGSTNYSEDIYPNFKIKKVPGRNDEYYVVSDLATIKNWGRNNTGVFEYNWHHDEKVKKLAEEIVNGEKNDVDKLFSIYKWINNKFEFNPNGNETRGFAENGGEGLSETLKKKALTSYEFNKIFFNLANELGIETKLIMGRESYTEELKIGNIEYCRRTPGSNNTLHYWNIAIVDGKEIWIDSSNYLNNISDKEYPSEEFFDFMGKKEGYIFILINKDYTTTWNDHTFTRRIWNFNKEQIDDINLDTKGKIQEKVISNFSEEHYVGFLSWDNEVGLILIEEVDNHVKNYYIFRENNGIYECINKVKAHEERKGAKRIYDIIHIIENE